jgi:hypothetical protein
MFVLIGALALSGCVNTGFRQVIEVKRGSSIEEKIEIAKSFATEERLAKLKKQIQDGLPGTTDQQLSRMALLWNDVRTTRPDGTLDRTITVTVILEERDGVNGPEVMRVASRLVDRDLNKPADGS